MLTRIRNAALARHDRVEMPHSQLKEHVAACSSPRATSTTCASARATSARRSPSSALRARPPVGDRRHPSRVHPGPPRLRPPRPHRQRVCSGMGISILSTSRGVMTDREAQQAARRRRAALRGLVSAMTTHAQTNTTAEGFSSRASASGRSPCRRASARRSRTAPSRSRARRGRSRACFRRASPRRSRRAACSSRRRSRAATARASRASPGRSSAAWSRAWPRATRSTLQLVGTGYRAELKGQVLQPRPRLLAPHRLPAARRASSARSRATRREQS